jgi:hypothetical protein
MTNDEQDWLINYTRTILSTCGYLFDPFQTRVIDGKEEALFGWLAVIVAFRSFPTTSPVEMKPILDADQIPSLSPSSSSSILNEILKSHPQSISYGAIDMGGASKQLAFEMKRDVDKYGHKQQDRRGRVERCDPDWLFHYPGKIT